jgi:hypothetical protein
MDQIEEKGIFDRATGKLDLYVPSHLKCGETDGAKAFLAPGGPYVRFAVKQFVKEQLGKLIKPGGEWKKESALVDMESVFEAVRKELPEHYHVKRDLIGYTFSEFVGVTINDILSFRVQRESCRYPTLAICVHGYIEGDDCDWMDLVADETDDELLALEANGDLSEGSAWFFPEQTKEFCRVAEYVYENVGRCADTAERKASLMREKYGL